MCHIDKTEFENCSHVLQDTFLCTFVTGDHKRDISTTTIPGACEQCTNHRMSLVDLGCFIFDLQEALRVAGIGRNEEFSSTPKLQKERRQTILGAHSNKEQISIVVDEADSQKVDDTVATYDSIDKGILSSLEHLFATLCNCLQRREVTKDDRFDLKLGAQSLIFMARNLKREKDILLERILGMQNLLLGVRNTSSKGYLGGRLHPGNVSRAGKENQQERPASFPNPIRASTLDGATDFGEHEFVQEAYNSESSDDATIVEDDSENDCTEKGYLPEEEVSEIVREQGLIPEQNEENLVNSDENDKSTQSQEGIEKFEFRRFSLFGIDLTRLFYNDTSVRKSGKLENGAELVRSKTLGRSYKVGEVSRRPALQHVKPRCASGDFTKLL